jgi:hypothetical protein
MLIGVCLVQTQSQRCATFAEVICAHRWLTSLDQQGGSATCARASSRAHARWLRTPASTPRSSRSTATNVHAASLASSGLIPTHLSSTLARPQRRVAARAMSSYRTMRMHECRKRLGLAAILVTSDCIVGYPDITTDFLKMPDRHRPTSASFFSFLSLVLFSSFLSFLLFFFLFLLIPRHLSLRYECVMFQQTKLVRGG